MTFPSIRSFARAGGVVALLAWVVLLPRHSRAADTPVQYVAIVSGIVCDGCEKHVREALARLPGASKVDIQSSDESGGRKVIITSTAGDLEKDDAVRILGDYAAQYKVISWKKE